MPLAPQSIQGSPSFTVHGIPAWVAVDGYEKGNSPERGPWRVVSYFVPWDQSDDFVDNITMSATLIGIPGSGVVIYNLPHQYPNNTNLVCLEASASPIGVPRPDDVHGRLFKADYALVHCTYGVTRFDIQGTDTNNSMPGLTKPFTQFKRHGSIGTERLPATSFGLAEATGANAVASPPAAIDVAPDTKPVHEYPITEFTIAHHMLPYVPGLIVEQLLNTLNDAEFGIWDVGQVKFVSFDTENEVDMAGRVVQTVTLTFQAKPWDWNTVPNPLDDAGHPDRRLFLARTSDGGLPYGYADFTPLLNP